MTILANAIGNLVRAPLEITHAALFEFFAIELDLFFDLASDQRLVRENLKCVEQLAVMFCELLRVTAVQPHDDLRLVLFGTHDGIELCERKYFLAPSMSDPRLLRFFRLFGSVDGEALKITRFEIVVFMTRSSAATARISAAIIATRSASATTTTSSTAITTARFARRRSRATRRFDARNDRRFRRRRRAFIHFGFDDDTLDAAEEAAFFDENRMRELVAFDAERRRCVVQCILETVSFEALAHRSPAHF